MDTNVLLKKKMLSAKYNVLIIKKQIICSKLHYPKILERLPGQHKKQITQTLVSEQITNP